MMPFMVQRIVRLSLYVRTLDSMRPTKKKAYLDKKELKDNINRLAAEIKGGEEDVMEEYEEAVDQLWISCGSAVDQLWIGCGSAVDQLWIS